MNRRSRNLIQRSAFLLGMLAFLHATLSGSGVVLAAKQIHPAIVRVVVPDGNYSTSYGTGTLVAASETTGLVLTNWHVVRDRKGQIEVRFPNGFRSAARVLHEDRDWDLAALLVWRPDVQPVRIATRAPQKGEALSIAGYGSGKYRTAGGKCIQYLSPGGNKPFDIVELSAGARQGDSGGPILNQHGEMAGVLFGSAGGCTSGSHAVRVRNFLAQIDPQLADGRLASLPQGPQSQYAQNVSPGPRIAAQYQGQSSAQAKKTTAKTSQPSSSGQHEAWIGVPGNFPHEASDPVNAQGEKTIKPAPVWFGTASATQEADTPKADGSQASEEATETDPSTDSKESEELPFWDQIKTILSLIGGLAILVQVAKLLNPDDSRTGSGTRKKRK